MCTLLLLALASSFRTEDATDSSDVLRAIENGYAANRESVDHGKVAFVFLECKASSPEAARRGEITDVVKAKGTYVFDGPKKRYELLYDRDDVISHTKVLDEHHSSIPFISDQVLTDGSVTLHNRPVYNPFTKTFKRQASIDPGIGGFKRSFRFPLNLGARELPGVDDIAYYLERARNGALKGFRAVKLEEDVILEGRKVHKVTFEYDEGTRTFWVDYQRGCVPVLGRNRTSQRGDQYTTYYEQLSLIGGKLWLPMRLVRYSHGGRSARILEIESIQVDRPPSDRDFQLTFSEPTAVVDSVHSRAYSNRTSFSLPNVANPDAHASRPVVIAYSAPPPTMPELPGEIKSSRSWIVCP